MFKVSPLPTGRYVKPKFHHHRTTEIDENITARKHVTILSDHWGMLMLMKLKRTGCGKSLPGNLPNRGSFPVQQLSRVRF